jgi:hypothetical protein
MSNFQPVVCCLLPWPTAVLLCYTWSPGLYVLKLYYLCGYLQT